MMKLNLMQAVVSTVDDQWESPLADEILQRWKHDEGHAKFWRASANFIFFFKNEGKDYVLRFNHTNERSVSGIQTEINFIKFLADQKVYVAQSIPSLTGNDVETIDTEHGTFHAVVFEALQGEQFDIDDELTPEQFTLWGNALGNLHHVAAQMTTTLDRPTWQSQLEMVSEILPEDEKDAWRTLEHLQKQLAKLRIDDDNYGLIHSDFELDNIIWKDRKAGIIDLDECAWNWHIADIVLALDGVLGDQPNSVDLNNPSYLHFINGYRSVRSIDQDELNLIPLFMQMKNLMKFAKLHRALTPVNPEGELSWMAGLRDKLGAQMQIYRDGFSGIVS